MEDLTAQPVNPQDGINQGAPRPESSPDGPRTGSKRLVVVTGASSGIGLAAAAPKATDPDLAARLRRANAQVVGIE